MGSMVLNPRPRVCRRSTQSPTGCLISDQPSRLKSTTFTVRYNTLCWVDSAYKGHCWQGQMPVPRAIALTSSWQDVVLNRTSRCLRRSKGGTSTTCRAEQGTHILIAHSDHLYSCPLTEKCLIPGYGLGRPSGGARTVEIQHPTPVWTIAAIGGLSALILPALKPDLLPAPLLQNLTASLGIEGLRRLAIAAGAVHVIETCVALRTGLKNTCPANVTAWYMLITFMYGYPGLVLLLRQVKDE